VSNDVRVPDARAAYLAAVRERVDALAQAGVRAHGNGFSSLVVLTAAGEPAQGLLAPDVTRALQAAFTRLRYAPEDWCVLSTRRADDEPLDVALLRQALITLDPATVVVVDPRAADDLRLAYAQELEEQDPALARFAPGTLVRLLGMRVLNVGDFGAALASSDSKQRAWAWLKRVPALGDPY
jgi:hypothetical protein